MNRRRAVLCSVAFAGLLGASPALAAQEAPDAFIERVSSEVLQRIETDPAIQSGDLARVSAFVEESVMPHVNFERMTASAVGRYWREATAEQRKELMTEFRGLLLRTYAGALSEARGTKLRLKPLRADPSDPEVIVRSELILRGREPIQLDYRLEKDGTGWRIFDLNVLGLWLVDNYRTQFSGIIGSSGIDGLIRTLAEKNRGAGGARS
ncbi:MAG: ABC transporter substrate-binding protein [Burkholderiales bacterium]|nr:MAG: ABC transporter substrate-binding protein [Burkholderiales bacterium]